MAERVSQRSERGLGKGKEGDMRRWRMRRSDRRR